MSQSKVDPMHRQLREILRHEFSQVAELSSVYLVTNGRELDVYARTRADDAHVAELAFECFRDATDRIMVECPSAPYLVWYGLTTKAVPRAQEIDLCVN
jgi:hypothetical protein